MARRARRHGLLIYREVLNRFSSVSLVLGLFLALLAWALYRDPLGQAQAWRWQAMVAVAGGTVLFSLLLFLMGRLAYVQVQPNYLKLVTPFFRVNISHKRLISSTTAEMGALFPPKSMRGWKGDLVAPLAKRTALVLELNDFPVPPSVLRVFLSPFFFKDRTPRLVILVNDWMRFSTELENLRLGYVEPGSGTPSASDRSILSHLPGKRR